MFSAWSKSACVGEYTSFAASIWPGCSTHLPSKPSAAERPATRRNPSTSLICRYGPSIACLSCARAAIRMLIRMWW